VQPFESEPVGEASVLADIAWRRGIASNRDFQLPPGQSRASAAGTSAPAPPRAWYHDVVSDRDRAARKARAAARQAQMTVEIVALGERKPSPYADSTAEERLAAAIRLIEHHQALRGVRATLPRSAWPGETFVAGAALG
jgi:hypothetical protein